jgi:2-dehydropantoate 2-reductase
MFTDRALQAVSVARAIGITEELLPSSSIQETAIMAQPKYDDPSKGRPYKPSMLVDLEAGRPMEVEGIIGAIVLQAREVGILVPR